jgi:hypothetical protein
MKRFLCYCLNVLSLEEEVLLADHGFRFTLAQRANLEKLWAHLRGEEEGEETEGDDETEEDEIEGGRPSSSSSRRSHDSPNNSAEGLQERILQVRLSIHTPYSIRRLMEYGIWNATHMELNPYIWKLRNDVIYIIN